MQKNGELGPVIHYYNRINLFVEGFSSGVLSISQLF